MSYITNQQDLLGEVINNILPESSSMKALVGFFYYSGFEQIYHAIKDLEVKILVGKDIEVDMLNRLKEIEYLSSRPTLSRAAIRDQYYQAITASINDTELLDSQSRQASFAVFVHKILDGSLQIRKTIEPNHAKLYLFKNSSIYAEHTHNPGTVITGSSNLTLSGLKNQMEINHISRVDHDFKQMDKLFDELWQTSIEIASPNTLQEFQKKVLEKIWINKLPDPYLMFLRVLKEFFPDQTYHSIKYPAAITGHKFNLRYQMDAIREGLNIIQKHDGVLIADVVGLGKSIIASTIAHNLNLKTIIICPPHLVPQWEEYRYEFGFNAKVYSCGVIENVLKELELSEKHKETKLIIIDEAHRFRNQLTQDYARLHDLCAGNKVMLLTATPYSNAPQDIFSLIKLFQIPARSTLQTIDSLSIQFQTLIREYKDLKAKQKKTQVEPSELKTEIRKISDQIRTILYPLVIRRSRIDLQKIELYRQDLEEQHISFPKVEAPVALGYQLGSMTELYIQTLDFIAPKDEEQGFQGVRYKPVNYVKNIKKYQAQIEKAMGDIDLFRQGQLNLAQFMRRQLVRRFESSIHAFRISLDNMIRSYEIIIDWYDRLGLVPIYKKGNIPDIDDLLDEPCDPDDEEAMELQQAKTTEALKALRSKGYFFLEKKEIKVSFREDMQKDLELLQHIKSLWQGEVLEQDPKLDSFIKHLKTQLKKEPQRKLLIFSEFADTVNYLHHKLNSQFRIFKYTSKEANQQNKAIIMENFDASFSKPQNNFDLLLATDAISEGFNLGRAGMVINYDIPYNPVRVIQRVGRINRISQKVYDELYIYNFFPSATGESEIRTKQIASLKLAMIQAILGEDTRIFSTEEELESFLSSQYIQANSEQEEESWDTSYLNLLHKIQARFPEHIDQAMKLPKRVRIQRQAKKEKGVLVFGKKGENCLFRWADESSQIHPITLPEAFQKLSAKPEEKGKAVSEAFEPIYQMLLKNLFQRKSRVLIDKGKADALYKLKSIKNILPDHHEYLDDLVCVLEQLDNLPERHARFIRKLDTEQIEKLIPQLQEEIPHEYLQRIIQKAHEIEDEKESIVLSEEFA